MKTKIGAIAMILLTLGMVGPAVAQIPVGDPFVVNSTTGHEKRSPDVAVAPNGNFAVTWWSNYQDGDVWGVFARWFDSTGTALTDEVQVNNFTLGNQYMRGIDADGQGRFVIVWVDDDRGVIVRRFDGAGIALGDELIVIASDLIADAAFSANSHGSFVVTWQRLTSPDNFVEGRRFGPDGLPLGEAFTVSTYSHNSWWEETAVELLDDHSFLVVWNDGQEVFARYYDTLGDPAGDEFQVSQLDPLSFASFDLDVASEDSGRFRIFWATDINLEENATMTRTFTGPSTLGSLIDLDLRSNGRPGYSMTGDGEFVVTRVWSFGMTLEGALFDAGYDLLSEFEIAPAPTYSLWDSNVAHTGTDSREFVAVWVDQQPPGEPFPDVMARRFYPIFADGFESGDTSVWSVVVP
jgi:hypothetical protein